MMSTCRCVGVQCGWRAIYGGEQRLQLVIDDISEANFRHQANNIGSIPPPQCLHAVLHFDMQWIQQQVYM